MKLFKNKKSFISTTLILLLLVISGLYISTFSVLTDEAVSDDLIGVDRTLTLKNYGRCVDKSSGDICYLNDIDELFSESYGKILLENTNDEEVESVTLQIYSNLDGYSYSDNFGKGLNEGFVKLSFYNYKTDSYNELYAVDMNGYTINYDSTPSKTYFLNDDTKEQTFWDYGLTGKVFEREDESKYRFINDDCITKYVNSGKDNYHTEKTQLNKCLAKEIVLNNDYVNNNTVLIKSNLHITRTLNSDPNGAGSVKLSKISVAKTEFADRIVEDTVIEKEFVEEEEVITVIDEVVVKKSFITIIVEWFKGLFK